MEKVVIVMPAWNEVENIKSMVEVLTQDEFPKIDADMQLLIVDNHSTDGTAEAAEDASKKYNNVHIIQQKNSGLGWAYVSGMQYAIDELKADAIYSFGNYDDCHIIRVVKPFLKSKTPKYRINAAIALGKLPEFEDESLYIVYGYLHSGNSRLIALALFAIGELNLKRQKNDLAIFDTGGQRTHFFQYCFRIR